MYPLALLPLLARTHAAPSYYDGYETVESPTQPVQMRVAFDGPYGVTISWNTFEKISNPTVHFAEEPFFLYRTASSQDSTTYSTSLTYNNHVKLNGLLPDTQYYVSRCYQLWYFVLDLRLNSTPSVAPTPPSRCLSELPNEPATMTHSQLQLWLTWAHLVHLVSQPLLE